MSVSPNRHFRPSESNQLARTRRAGTLKPPQRIAAAEIEIDFGKARFQHFGTADISDLNLRLLATERQQIDLTDRGHRGEPIPHHHPLAQATDRDDRCKARRLVGILLRPLDVGCNCVRRAL